MHWQRQLRPASLSARLGLGLSSSSLGTEGSFDTALFLNHEGAHDAVGKL